MPEDGGTTPDKRVQDLAGDLVVADGDATRPDPTDADVAGGDEVSEDLGPVDGGCEEGGYECGTWLEEGGDVIHCGVCPEGLFCNADGKCQDSPDCSVDLFKIGELNIAGFGSKATVEAGEVVPVVFSWLIGNSAGCTNCTREVALGFEQEAGQAEILCVDVGIVGNCPSFDVGYGVGTLAAPSQAGSWDIIAEVPTGPECSSPDYEFEHEFSAVKVGTFVVVEHCDPVSCDETGKECGEWDDGCGSTVQCGACAAGKVCDEDGKCVWAESCALDVFEITQVYIKSFGNFATVSVGEPVPVLYSWMLGSAKELDGADRQIVIGIDNKPGACEEVGIPDTCPAFDAGLGNANLAAPMNGGTYTVFAVATAGDTCDEAMAEYGVTFPRMAIGTLEVIGSCNPATCGSLNVECGYWDDICEGVVYCSGCPEEEVCGPEGKCTENPNCQYPVFEVAEVGLGLTGGGTAVIEAGTQVPVVLDWKAGNPQDCENCPRQLVLGLESGPALCFDLGMVQTCPAFDCGCAGGFLTAPDFPGGYILSAALVHATSCTKAMEAFPNEEKTPIGTLLVEGGCLAASCETLGSNCGDWGDGCGGILHCGVCQEGQACNSQGVCESPCIEGIFDISQVSINGSGKVASASPGMDTQVVLGWKLGNPDDCPECHRQVVVGVADDAGFCVDAGVPPECPGSTSGSKSSHVQAPDSQGSYTVFAMAPSEDDCDAAKLVYESSPFKTPVGTLHVTGGCQPKNCLSMGKKCGTMDDGCGYTLECGECAAGKLCNDQGKCYCSKSDEYEPNDSPGSAYEMGTFTDKDIESKHFIEAAVQNEEDWFHMGATDVSWAYMEPYVSVEMGLPVPFKMTVAFMCLDGTFPAMDEIANVGCEYKSGINLSGVSGGSNAKAFVCESDDGSPVSIQFGPGCAGIDDSGDMYVGIKTGGQCSAYELDLNL